MSREIKFRAWDTKESKMIPAIGLTEDGTPFLMQSIYKEKVGAELRKQNASCVAFGKDEVHIMQFTGLLDKNRKEIYEGDIVKGWLVDGKIMKKKPKISTVIYNHRGFWINGENFGWEGECMWDWDNLEVIGNIYENPELLKQKK